jgi:hypothetical protein
MATLFDRPLDKLAPRAMPPAVIDVMADAGVAPFRRVAGAIVTAATVMALLGSDALLKWANDLPISATSDTILAVAQSWQDALSRLGLPEVAADLRAAFRRFQGWGK